MAKKKNPTKQQQTRERIFAVLHPFYVPCSLEQAEREVGAQRAAELVDLAEGHLTRATVELDKLLNGTFSFRNGLEAGRDWTLEQYRDELNLAVPTEGEPAPEEPELVDVAGARAQLHEWHGTQELLLTRDLTLEWAEQR